MIKLNILNIKRFLQVVNECKGEVYVVHPDGYRENINKRERVQDRLRIKYKENKNYLPLALDFADYRDYLSVVYYAVGDC